MLHAITRESILKKGEKNMVSKSTVGLSFIGSLVVRNRRSFGRFYDNTAAFQTRSFGGTFERTRFSVNLYQRDEEGAALHPKKGMRVYASRLGCRS